MRMATCIPLCKVTVLKRNLHQDLIEQFLKDNWKPNGPCECFEEEQEFIIDPSKAPREFYSRCSWAWADIYKNIVNVASGVNMIGLKQSRTMITGCTDWFRPVIFKIERLD